MDKEKQKIIIDTYGGLTHGENFELVRLFVSSRANEADKSLHENMFKNHLSKITNPDYREEFIKYYKESQNAGGLFGKSQEAVLMKSLTNLYKLHYAEGTDIKFAERIVQENGFKIIIQIEAKNLLSGTRSYSTEVAAKEAGKLRDTINGLGKLNSELKIDNREKTLQLEKTTRSLSNLVDNLRGLFGLKPESIEKMTSKGFKEANGIGSDEIGKLKVIDRFSIEKVLGDDNYPAGVQEKEIKSYDLLAYKENKYLLKEQVSYYDLDGRSSRDIPKIYQVSKEDIKILSKELSAERGKVLMDRLESFKSLPDPLKGKIQGFGM
ncbi:MAG: hypothetical protein HOP30_10140 [Cyclobacteriaceae bacterium]|nr:hypothetical protein [Cyclobacteriaceae bacterium]